MSETRLIALRLPNRRLAARLNELWDAGLAALPISSRLPEREVRALLASLRPDRIEDTGGASALPGGRAVAAEVAAVVATSGSSGEPKGVELTHAALRWSAEAYRRHLGYDLSERWLACLPLSHVGGLGIVYRARVAGTEPAVHDGFDVAAVAEEGSASLISLVPAALVRLLDAGVDLRRFTAVLIGGSGLAPSIAERARRAGVAIVATYGMTETAGACAFDGHPLEGAEIRLAGEQILVRGPMLMRGYRLQPDLTEQVLRRGWFATSDRGRFDADGRLEVLGRLDDAILTGGEKVPAPEVEGLLLQHPAVVDVAVVGVPDARWGEAVVALIVPRAGTAPTIADVKEFLIGRAAPYKIPKRVHLVASLPRSPAGKLQRGRARGTALRLDRKGRPS